MANIRKYKMKNGKYSYKAIIRVNDGYPPDYKSFPTRQEAKDWATQIEASRRQGSYFPEQVKAKHTLADLIEKAGRIKDGSSSSRRSLRYVSEGGRFM